MTQDHEHVWTGSQPKPTEQIAMVQCLVCWLRVDICEYVDRFGSAPAPADLPPPLTDRPREHLAYGDLSDAEMAERVYTLGRFDVEHDAVVTGARDRILYLSDIVKNLIKMYAALRRATKRANSQTQDGGARQA